MKILFSAFSILAILWCFTIPSLAQLNTTGFIRNYNALRTQAEHELIAGRNRLRLDFNQSLSQGQIVISNDIQNIYTQSADSINYRLREAYVDLYFKSSDLRIGKQIITWGRAEGTFITDILTPVDITEFLTQDFADLRLGITAIKYSHYFGSDYLQLVVNPVFKPNKLPSLGNRWFPQLPFSTSIPINLFQGTPEAKLKNVQLAGRYAFRSNLDYDLDLGLLYWNYPTPRYSKTLQAELPTVQLNLSEQYTQSFIAMYSGSFKLTDKLILTSESAYYNNRLVDYFPEALQSLDLQNPAPAELFQIGQIFSQNEDGFLKERPWLISMLGLQYNFWGITANGQFVNEHTFDYDPTILQDQNFVYTTLSLRRGFFRDTLELLGFSRYNFSGQDFWINSEITYTGIDAVEFSAGAHLFGGNNPGEFYGHVSFEDYAQNSFAYLRVSAYF